MTLEYLGDRYSFGRPLSSYQALKHRVADDKLWLEACHASPPAPPRRRRRPDAAELVSAAKAWIGPHATELVQDCVQLHGGIGVTWEHDLHLYLRRATVNRATYGTPEEHAERIATGCWGRRRDGEREELEPVEAFRPGRAWLAENMPPFEGMSSGTTRTRAP